MTISRLPLRVLGVLLLATLLWPLIYAAWVSFSPGELLQPPTDDWSLRWYRLFFSSPRWTRALTNSLVVAILSVLVSLLAGTSLALAVTRCHFSGARFLSGAVLLPLFVPGVVLGMGLLPLFHAIGLVGWRLSLALAHGLIALPVVFLGSPLQPGGGQPRSRTGRQGAGGVTGKGVPACDLATASDRPSWQGR